MKRYLVTYTYTSRAEITFESDSENEAAERAERYFTTVYGPRGFEILGVEPEGEDED